LLKKLYILLFKEHKKNQSLC